MGDLLIYLIATLITLFTGFAYVYPSIKATEMKYSYSEKLVKLAKLSEKNKKLKLELLSTSSFHFIEESAINKLGLQYPNPKQLIIVVKSDEKTE